MSWNQTSFLSFSKNFLEGLSYPLIGRYVKLDYDQHHDSKLFMLPIHVLCIYLCGYLKWLRAVPKGSHTGAHVDRIYMGRGTENLYTTWIPFGDNPPEMGSLCMLHKSNQ